MQTCPGGITVILMPYVDERILLRRNILDHSNLSFPDIFRYLNCLKDMFARSTIREEVGGDMYLQIKTQWPP